MQIAYGDCAGLTQRSMQDRLCITNGLHVHVLVLYIWQALAVLSAKSSGWVCADISQSIDRMPTVYDFDQPFPVITPYPQLSFQEVCLVSCLWVLIRPAGKYWLRAAKRPLTGLLLSFHCAWIVGVWQAWRKCCSKGSRFTGYDWSP